MALSMERKEVFCKARYKQRIILLEDCVPNPYHPACRECDSPNIEMLKDDDLRLFRRGSAQQRKAGQGRKKWQRLPEDVEDDDALTVEEDEEPPDGEILYVEDVEDEDYYDEDDHEY